MSDVHECVLPLLLLSQQVHSHQRHRLREGRREGVREGGREGGREGEREGGRGRVGGRGVTLMPRYICSVHVRTIMNLNTTTELWLS